MSATIHHTRSANLGCRIAYDVRHPGGTMRFRYYWLGNVDAARLNERTPYDDVLYFDSQREAHQAAVAFAATH